jgi:hypothetical protein
VSFLVLFCKCGNRSVAWACIYYSVVFNLKEQVTLHYTVPFSLACGLQVCGSKDHAWVVSTEHTQPS